MTSTTPPPTSEGYAPFTPPGSSDTYKTYYKVYGTLPLPATPDAKRPLVIAHGGPGSTHDYVLPLTSLHTTYGVPLVFYDQLGGGRSTRLPEKKGDVGFWTDALFVEELENLLAFIGIKENEEGYDVLGHSWGGMLVMRWAATKQPKGLRRLVVSSSPASMKLFVEGAMKLRRALPQDVQDALDKHEAAGTTDSEEYHAAEQAFYARHLCRVQPTPEGLQASFELMSEDSTVYHTMNGPSEFHITGSLKTWSIVSDLPKIAVPTLLLNGRYDEVQDVAVQPLFEGIRKVRWVTLEQSSHLAYVEEKERYNAVVGGFLGY